MMTSSSYVLAKEVKDAAATSTARRLQVALAEVDERLRRPLASNFEPTLPVVDESRCRLLAKIMCRGEQDEKLSSPRSSRLQFRHSWAPASATLNRRLRAGRRLPRFCTTVRLTAASAVSYTTPLLNLESICMSPAWTALSLRTLVSQPTTSGHCSSSLRTRRASRSWMSSTSLTERRADSQKLGELQRGVNSFIQNLDTYGGQAVVIATTNQESLLEIAIWRRFSYRTPRSAGSSGEVAAVPGTIGIAADEDCNPRRSFSGLFGPCHPGGLLLATSMSRRARCENSIPRHARGVAAGSGRHGLRPHIRHGPRLTLCTGCGPSAARSNPTVLYSHAASDDLLVCRVWRSVDC